jgi:hypothetical protein
MDKKSATSRIYRRQEKKIGNPVHVLVVHMEGEE